MTHFNRLYWDNGVAPTTVIEHGIVDPGARYTGELARGAVVVNEPGRRGRTVGADLVPGFARIGPVDVFGMQTKAFVAGLDTDAVAAHQDLFSQDDMHSELARRRVYLHPMRWTSLGLSLIEAMQLAMPVVAVAATEAVVAVPPAAGVLSTDPERLHAGLPHLPARAGGRPSRRGRRSGRRAGAVRADPVPRRLGRGARPGRGREAGADRMRIAMVSEHASPLATLGGVDAGGQNVHVAALATALVERGHDVVVYTRRDSPTLPRRVAMRPGLHVEHVDAGPAVPIAKDSLLPYMGAFAHGLARTWAAWRPDVVHAHFWMSGLASVQAAARHGVPVVQTFHALGVVKRRWQGDQDTSPASRLEIEREVACRADRVIATCSDEAAELARPRGAVRPGRRRPLRRRRLAVPADRATQDRSRSRPRLLIVGRLVPRKGVEDAIRAVALVPGVELVVVGGPAADQLDDDPEVARLRQVVAECGVADRVVLTGHRRARRTAGDHRDQRPAAGGAVVRAVRHHGAGGDGLRGAGGRLGGGRPAGHRRSRGDGVAGHPAGPRRASPRRSG